MKYLKILCQMIKEPTYFLKDPLKKSCCNFLHLLIHYFLIPDVGRGPSAKFQVENVHTAAELKMTGNCLLDHFCRSIWPLQIKTSLICNY